MSQHAFDVNYSLQKKLTIILNGIQNKLYSRKQLNSTLLVWNNWIIWFCICAIVLETCIWPPPPINVSNSFVIALHNIYMVSINSILSHNPSGKISPHSFKKKTQFNTNIYMCACFQFNFKTFHIPKVKLSNYHRKSSKLQMGNFCCWLFFFVTVKFDLRLQTQYLRWFGLNIGTYHIYNWIGYLKVRTSKVWWERGGAYSMRPNEMKSRFKLNCNI